MLALMQAGPEAIDTARRVFAERPDLQAPFSDEQLDLMRAISQLPEILSAT